jgi:regulator of nucleoside diphosphate kinase
MKYSGLVFEKDEYEALKELLNEIGSRDAYNQAGFDKLRREMTTARICEGDEMPCDVVRMYSYIDVRTPMGYVQGYQLVPPAENNPNEKKISVLKPMGAAVIGYAAGDKLSWFFPSGEHEITIEKVYEELNDSKVL